MKYKYLYLFLAAIFAFSCTKPDDILNDFQVHISPTFYKYIVEVEVEDLQDPEAALPNDLTIEITGDDAAAIYNIDGSRNYKVNFGTLQLMVSREMEPTPGSPLNFAIKFSANNYETSIVPIRIEEEDYFLSEQAQLLDLGNLPTGINNNTASGSIAAGTSALTNEISFTAASGDSATSTDITLPAGVTFLDENGNAIVAKRAANAGVNINVVSYSDTSRSAQAAMPLGGGMIQPVEDGTPGSADTILMQSSPDFNLSIDVDGVPVESLGGGKTMSGATARVYLRPGLNNFETGAPFAAGDEVSMLFFNNNVRRWVRVNNLNFTVEALPNGRLYIDYPITQARGRFRLFHRLGYTPPVLAMRLGAFLTKSDGSAEPNGSFTTNMFFSFNKAISGRIHRRYVRLGGRFTGNPLRGTQRRFRVNRIWWDNVTSLNSASDRATYNISVEESQLGTVKRYFTKFQPKATAVSIGYRLFCEGSNTLVDPPAGVKMYYRETGSGDQFSLFYTFTQANAGVRLTSFPQLQNNTTYDFRARFNDVEKDTTNVMVVDQRVYDVTLPSGACNSLGL
jgi:hypothetical protein